MLSKTTKNRKHIKACSRLASNHMAPATAITVPIKILTEKDFTPANISTFFGLTGEENTKCTSLGRNRSPRRLA